MSRGTLRYLVTLTASILSVDLGSRTEEQKQTLANATRLRATLPVNGFQAPFPSKVPNQRQRRKRLRQVPQLK